MPRKECSVAKRPGRSNKIRSISSYSKIRFLFLSNLENSQRMISSETGEREDVSCEEEEREIVLILLYLDREIERVRENEGEKKMDETNKHKLSRMARHFDMHSV